MILLALQHWFSKMFIKVTVIRTKCINSRFVVLQRKSIHHNALAFPLIEVVIWFKDGYYPFFTQSHHIYTKDIDQILCFVKVLRERERDKREKERERDSKLIQGNWEKECQRENFCKKFHFIQEERENRDFAKTAYNLYKEIEREKEREIEIISCFFWSVKYW